MAANSAPHTASTTLLFLGDDLALDFINTAYGVDEEHQECLGSDAQVLDWLQRAGLPFSLEGVPTRAGTLLKAALALREAARKLVEQRKAGNIGAVAPLNRVLALGSTYRELVWSKRQEPAVELRRRVASAEALLVPVAEAVAALLAQGDFALVRTCESSDCTLWFHDHTKSHRRRWCSMAQCGNRQKVAAFRARQKAE
jgi:predicted RNA-binding Zn ribbon-like protein